MFDRQVGRIAGMGQVLIAPLEFPRGGLLVGDDGRISRLSATDSAATDSAATDSAATDSAAIEIAVTRLGISTCILRLPAGRLFPGGLRRRTARPCRIGGFATRRSLTSRTAGSILGPLILTSLRLSGPGGRSVVAWRRTGCCVTFSRVTLSRLTPTRLFLSRLLPAR
jgi:hypothetical protein